MGAFFRWFLIVSVVLPACSGCTKTPPDPSGRDAFESRATAQLQGQVTVRAAVLGDEESSRFFGVSLADKGMQAVWFSVKKIAIECYTTCLLRPMRTITRRRRRHEYFERGGLARPTETGNCCSHGKPCLT